MVVGLSAMVGRCPGGPKTETILNAIVSSLIWERRLSPGVILDAGAFDGTWACFYAQVAAEAAPSPSSVRPILAIDPDEANVESMRRFGVSNLFPMMSMLGNRSAHIDPAEASSLRDASGHEAIRLRNRSTAYRAALHVPMLALDDLFMAGGRWAGQRLALAHLDVEGNELMALRGASELVRRDRPVIVTEVTVHLWRAEAEALLRHMTALDYDSYLIEEIVGIRADLRNIIHFPRERFNQFRASSALTIATVTRGLQAVQAESLAQHAFPCCERGRECCSVSKDGRAKDCCAHYKVHDWMRAAMRNGSDDLQWYTRHTWYDQAQLRFRPSDEMLLLQQQVRSRPLSRAGFSYVVQPNHTLLGAMRARRATATAATRRAAAARRGDLVRHAQH